MDFVHIHDGAITIVRYKVGKGRKELKVTDITVSSDDRLTKYINEKMRLMSVHPFATFVGEN